MSARFRHSLILFAVLAAAALPTILRAQTETGLRSRISDELFTFGSCGQPLCLDVDNAHGDHFIPSLAEGNDAVISFVTAAIGNATLSVPLAATSSGATFTFSGGLPVATSTSAGPIFGERTQTLGKGRFFFGASVTGVQFKSLNGIPLDGLVLNFKHQDGDPTPLLGDPTFENDIIALDLAMDVNVVVGTLAVTYGLTDFIDVGVALPLVRTSVSGRSDAQIQPFGNQTVHRFGGDDTDPIQAATATMDGSAAGLGDITARMKINFGQGTKMGAGLLTEVTLPTGDEEDLLGTGSAQIRALGLYSAQFGTFSPHLNLGYIARTGESQRDAVEILAAFDNLLTDWATLAVGFEAQLQVGENPFVLPGAIQFDDPLIRAVRSTNIPEENGDLLRASIGGKFTVREGMVLYANGLFPLRQVGLQPDFIWTLGLDFPF